MASAKRVEKLDGLRGLAICTIIVLHWYIFPFRDVYIEFSPELYAVLRLMKNSVDLFFVNSGFLIGSILLTQCDSNNFVKAFYIRRFYRIVPLYYLVLATMLFKVTTGAWECDGDPAPYYSFFLFINNIFHSMGNCVPQELGPSWSLAIEEQFYFTGAMTAVFFGRRGVLIYALILLVTAPTSRALIYFMELPIDYWLFSLSHMDSIGIGMLMAVATKNQRIDQYLQTNMRLVYALAGVCLLFFIASPFLPAALTVIFQITAISFFTGFVILIIIYRDGANILKSRLLVLAGRTCFSLFLLHQIVMLWTYSFSVQLGIHYLWGFAAALPVLCLMVHLTWTYIELPLIELGRKHKYIREPDPVAKSSA